METVILKIALPIHDAERLAALLDQPEFGKGLSERDQILATLGYATNDVIINGIAATQDGRVYPLADTGWILDARIENRSEFEDTHV